MKKTMPNPTRRQRERVVELLRCGMDCWLCALPFSATVERCAPSRAVESLAYKVWRVVFNEAKRDARIEEGWCPNG